MKNWLILLVFSLAVGLLLIIATTISPQGEKVNKMADQLQISSPAFQNNHDIPKKYTCRGEGVNPPLEIDKVPKTTQSLALILEDPDAPIGTFYHWIVLNIDPKTKTIAEDSTPNKGIEGLNSAGKIGYVGPCPPSGTHHYIFKIFALDKIIKVDEETLPQVVEKMLEPNVLAKGQLIGLFSSQ